MGVDKSKLKPAHICFTTDFCVRGKFHRSVFGLVIVPSLSCIEQFNDIWLNGFRTLSIS